jgi:RHS repeat-associated protein
MAFYHLLRAHPGSSNLIADDIGNVSNAEFYYPFGGNRGSAFSSLTTKRFTGQYHEVGLPGSEGLSYYNARWYDAQLGRFASADTLVVYSGENDQWDWTKTTCCITPAPSASMVNVSLSPSTKFTMMVGGAWL